MWKYLTCPINNASFRLGFCPSRNQPRLEAPNNRDTPMTSGEIDTTKRHHFRPPRAAVFNRRQQLTRQIWP